MKSLIWILSLLTSSVLANEFQQPKGEPHKMSSEDRIPLPPENNCIKLRGAWVGQCEVEQGGTRATHPHAVTIAQSNCWEIKINDDFIELNLSHFESSGGGYDSESTHTLANFSADGSVLTVNHVHVNSYERDGTFEMSSDHGYRNFSLKDGALVIKGAAYRNSFINGKRDENQDQDFTVSCLLNNMR